MSKRIPLTQGKFAIVDDEDFDKFNSLKWHFNNGYACRRENAKKGGIYLHRLITKCPKGKIVDHINRNRLDNRKCNLRITDYSVNMRNTKKFAGSSKYRGVHFTQSTKDRPWRAAIKVYGKNVHIGIYRYEVEAARARDQYIIDNKLEVYILNNVLKKVNNE